MRTIVVSIKPEHVNNILNGTYRFVDIAKTINKRI